MVGSVDYGYILLCGEDFRVIFYLSERNIENKNMLNFVSLYFKTLNSLNSPLARNVLEAMI